MEFAVDIFLGLAPGIILADKRLWKWSFALPQSWMYAANLTVALKMVKVAAQIELLNQPCAEKRLRASRLLLRHRRYVLPGCKSLSTFHLQTLPAGDLESI